MEIILVESERQHLRTGAHGVSTIRAGGSIGVNPGTGAFVHTADVAEESGCLVSGEVANCYARERLNHAGAEVGVGDRWELAGC